MVRHVVQIRFRTQFGLTTSLKMSFGVRKSLVTGVTSTRRGPLDVLLSRPGWDQTGDKRLPRHLVDLYWYVDHFLFPK